MMLHCPESGVMYIIGKNMRLCPTSNRNHTIPLIRISKQIYTDFDNVEIFYVSKRKLRIVAETKEDANKLSADLDLRKQYRIFILLRNVSLKQ